MRKDKSLSQSSSFLLEKVDKVMGEKRGDHRWTCREPLLASNEDAVAAALSGAGAVWIVGSVAGGTY